MAKKEETEASAAGGGSGVGGEVARLIGVLGINLVLVLVVVIFASSQQGALPDLNRTTLMIGLLPVSAAFGLVLACRRLDLALPMVLALAVALRGHPPKFFPDDPYLQIAAVCGAGAAVGLVSALVTWIGRISSALWTGLLAGGLWLLSQQVGGQGPWAWPTALVATLTGTTGPELWAWPAALAASLGLLVVGAAVLGATGLVSLPSMPPIIRTGAKGLVGLVGAWVLAGAAVGLAAQSEAAGPLPDQPLAAYAVVLASGALGGAYILRGRWGALVAVLLTSLSHLAWSFAWSADMKSPMLHLGVVAGIPLIALPLYLAVDWLIRRETSESAPTGLLA
jgi:hypothetical protein